MVNLILTSICKRGGMFEISFLLSNLSLLTERWTFFWWGSSEFFLTNCWTRALNGSIKVKRSSGFSVNVKENTKLISFGTISIIFWPNLNITKKIFFSLIRWKILILLSCSNFLTTEAKKLRNNGLTKFMNVA